MKRLLLAPLLIALSGCSTDIVQKNSLGEKTIIKHATVSIKDETLDEWREEYKNNIFEAKENEKYYQSKIDECFLTVNRLKLECNNYSTKIYKNKYEKAIKDIKFMVPNLKWYEQVFQKYKGTEIVTKYVTYQPIFQDLNNVKSIGEKRTLDCRSPLYIKLFLGGKVDDYYIDFDRRICDKYAKF